ncbi:unnamed protein product, partial [Ectocarpus sp. 12 AP-2014]
ADKTRLHPWIDPRRGYHTHVRPVTVTDLPFGPNSKDTKHVPQIPLVGTAAKCCRKLQRQRRVRRRRRKTPSFYRTLRNVAGAIDTLERVRPATVCRCGVCPVLDDARRELALLPPAAPSPVVAKSAAAIS